MTARTYCRTRSCADIAVRVACLAFGAWFAATGAALAQTIPRTSAYRAVAITPAPQMPAEAQAAVAGLRKAVDTHDAKTLAARVASPLERLRLALCCEGKDDPSVSANARDEALWGVLGSLLQSAAPGANPDIKNAVCVPGLPVFDRAAARAIVRAAAVEPEGLRVASAAFDARAQPDAKATIRYHFEGGTIVPLAGALTEPPPAGWTALALPEGGIGYANDVALEETTPQSLCLRPGPKGWTLAVLILRNG
jgi:hypothetical protein